MSKAWFEAKCAVRFGALPSHARPIHELFTGAKSSSAAAEQLASSNLKHHDDTDWRLWQLIFDAAEELPQHHGAIIDLVLALQTEHDTHRPDDAGLKAWMKSFGGNYRDRLDLLWAWRGGGWKKEPAPIVSDPRERLANFIVWSACLLESAFRQRFQMKALAWCDVAKVLEAESESYGGELWLDVAVVAQWILHAPSLRTTEGEESDRGAEFLHAQKGLWKGGAGFTLERWDFWKGRLNDCVQAGILPDETAEAVKVAVAKMSQS
ncbi:hypothetical protein DIS24_g10142 [Lasiodiplodia hormozganensis]|uniref:Uncharacterized protein n=1 Tax=Lasiodiplodia hormozganensis TaxID=869390 RepID=A0AA40CI60_9PEZI|nr:hypothetical protein DIS24_g10142 [Lasiodiplodia hormozganensis]